MKLLMQILKVNFQITGTNGYVTYDGENLIDTIRAFLSCLVSVLNPLSCLVPSLVTDHGGFPRGSDHGHFF